MRPDSFRPDFTPDSAFTAYAKRLRDLIEQSARTVAFTGAGMSVESGIPTYRGTGRLQSQYDSDKYASIEYFHREPAYYWNYFRDVRFPSIENAKPNLGHLALAELERRGILRGVITQNIDGLHQEAGSRKVLELHGNTRQYYCLKCGRRYDFREVREKVDKENPVHCDNCSGLVRPAVIMFGEALDYDVMESAHVWCLECDLLLIIGSSLVVYPAAEFPLVARRAGAKLAIINVDPTPIDPIVEFTAHCPAGNLLAQTVWHD